MAKKQIINGKLQCSSCKYMLPLDHFGNKKRNSFGKDSICKACYKAKYGSKRNIPTNCGIIGLHSFKCPQCSKEFTTKNPAKVYCSQKCNRRNWYEKNQQSENAKRLNKC